MEGEKSGMINRILYTLFIKSSSVSKGKLKLKDFIDSRSLCGCKLLHRIPDPSILKTSKKMGEKGTKKNIPLENGALPFSLFSPFPS